MTQRDRIEVLRLALDIVRGGEPTLDVMVDREARIRAMTHDQRVELERHLKGSLGEAPVLGGGR